jgi:hypothetical protein
MEKEFVNYNQALKLKALGFDEPCFGWYEHNGNFYYCYQEGLVPPSPSKKLIKGCCLAPTFSQVFRWFREKYFYLSYVCSPYKEYNEFYFRIRHIGDVINEGELENFESQVYKSYEETELACLTKLIELVESKSEQDESKTD